MNFDRYCIKSVDQLWYCSHFHRIHSVNREAGRIFPLSSVFFEFLFQYLEVFFVEFFLVWLDVFLGTSSSLAILNQYDQGSFFPERQGWFIISKSIHIMCCMYKLKDRNDFRCGSLKYFPKMQA